jgi:hypothetical protein
MSHASLIQTRRYRSGHPESTPVLHVLALGFDKSRCFHKSFEHLLGWQLGTGHEGGVVARGVSDKSATRSEKRPPMFQKGSLWNGLPYSPFTALGLGHAARRTQFSRFMPGEP